MKSYNQLAASKLEPHLANLRRSMQELQRATVVAGLNYDIWVVYKTKRYRTKYLSTMNEHGLFFNTSLSAHFIAAIVHLYWLYETPDDRFNIPSLLKFLRQEQILPAAKLNHLDRLYQKAKPLWIKVNILRSNVFGHRSRKNDISEFFTQAKITPADLKKLIRQTQTLLNKISYEIERNTYAFNLSAEKDTIHLLEVLRTHEKARDRKIHGKI